MLTDAETERLVTIATTGIKLAHKNLVDELMRELPPELLNKSDTVVTLLATATLGLGVAMCRESELDVAELVHSALAALDCTHRN